MADRTLYRCAIPILIALLSFGAGARNATAEDAAASDTTAEKAPAQTASATMPREIGVCLDCHDEKEATLAPTAHSLVGEPKSGKGAAIACTDCHIGDKRHWEDDPDDFPMKSPAKLSAREEAAVCSKCHKTSHQQNMAERNVHMTNDVNCSSCHSVHGSKAAVLLKAPEAQLCVTCHRNVETDFAKPYRHPVKEGIVKCSDCHMKLDLTRRDLSFNGENVCVKCHNEMQGPFPFEHQATLDFSTDEGGCVTCHAPHGSALPRMLKQPYQAPSFQLCTQCHAVPPKHNLNINHGTAWAGKACSDCHTDIHGSYSNRFLLSESLESEGCLTPSCHLR
ncbi:MAG: cytochrome c3 family protein [Hyphomicrobiales bacterium]